jgi:putative transposase
VLDYIVTSNHFHLLVKGTGRDVIAHRMQLIAGQSAQNYNERKGRHGAVQPGTNSVLFLAKRNYKMRGS